MSKKKEIKTDSKLVGGYFRLPESLKNKVDHTCLDLKISFQGFMRKLINDYYTKH